MFLIIVKINMEDIFFSSASLKPQISNSKILVVVCYYT